MSDRSTGVCPECGRKCMVKKDGTIRHHQEVEYGTFLQRKRCPGAGKPPRRNYPS